MTNHTAVPARIGAPLAAAALLLAGCADNKNQRLTIGDSIPLASFPPEVVEVELDESGNPLPQTPPADDEPTAMGLDRSNFAPIVYRVPIDGTRHEAHGSDRLALTNETARQRGEFPTARSALDTGGPSSTRRQVAEAFLQPFYAVGGVIRSLVVSSSGARSSPAGLYERAPAPSDPMQSGVIHQPLAADTGERTNENDAAEPDAPSAD